MDRVLFALYVCLALAALVQTALMALQTYEHRRYSRRRMEELDGPRPQGKACVLAPCKGLDEGLEENLSALLDQDYPDYEVLFIVESAGDPACAAIRRVMSRRPAARSRLVVAGEAAEGGQKIHNLLVGLQQAAPDTTYLAFVDSDAQPRRQWLRWLLYRLDDPGVGATTGYRWFVPKRPTLANHVLYSINCTIALYLGPHRWHYVWGGSWAIRRAMFEELDVAGAWRNTLSDDMVAAALLRRRRLQTVFQPPCMAASPADYDWPGLLQFLRRQYLMVRSYSPRMWALSVITSGVYVAAVLWGAGLAAWGLASGRPWAWIAAWFTLAIYGLGAFRAGLRQSLVRSYFPDLELRLRAARRFDVWGHPAAAMVQWLGLIGSAVGRHVVWRGVRYRLASGGQVARLPTVAETAEHASVPFTSGSGQARRGVPPSFPVSETPSRRKAI